MANLTSAVAGVLVVVAGIAAVMWMSSADDHAAGTSGRPGTPAAAAAGPDGGPAKLLSSSTHSTLKGAPRDPDPQANTDGTIVRPKKVLLVRDAPGGKAFGKIGPNQIGETWLPRIGGAPGWTQVLLPSRPNGSTGWLPTAQLERKFTPYAIAVHLSSMRLELFFEERQVGEWEIGIGKPSTPTPVGRTFVLGSIVDPAQDYSPIILPLGTHSATLDSYGGGPGTVAIHTWPTSDVFGKAGSDGCIRVPKAALDKLTQVPLGTLVIIDDH